MRYSVCGVGSRTEKKYLNLRWSDELLWVIADVMACSQWKRTWKRKHSTMSEELSVKNLHQIFPKFYMGRLCDIGLFTAFAPHDDRYHSLENSIIPGDNDDVILGLSIDLLPRPWFLLCVLFWPIIMWTSPCLPCLQSKCWWRRIQADKLQPVVAYLGHEIHQQCSRSCREWKVP